MIIIGLILINVLKILQYLLLAHIILSWLKMINGFFWKISEVVDELVEPILKPFRKVIPVIQLGAGALDITALIVYLLLGVLIQVVARVLF